METSSGKPYLLVLMLVVVILLGWLWASWVAGWFPFVSGRQPARQDVLNSLTATSTPAAPTVLNELTPAPAAGTTSASVSPPAPTPADTNAVLESLTPKK
ncbi:MAG TPA: hypothetical protein PLW99_02080 [Candidatus Paceibacterota bacterium]|nr:MAG: hypothetical protein B7X03_00005 [Parcubacteria group bacterium 21-58-10]HQT82919.1 hypothetical protein [Candidatus Paceibacterota bacterium]